MGWGWKDALFLPYAATKAVVEGGKKAVGSMKSPANQGNGTATGKSPLEAQAEEERRRQQAEYERQQEEARRAAEDLAIGNRGAIDASVNRGETWSPLGNDQSNQGVGEQSWRIHEKDFFAPGRGEQWMDQNAGTYAKQGFGEKTAQTVAGELGSDAQGGSAGQQYWNQVRGEYNAGGPGYVKDAYDSFDASVDPNLGGYYDRAMTMASGNVNKQLAARGAFGSSVGMEQLNNVAVGLGAERANREADYGLRRFDTKMRGAQAASGDELGWTQGLGSIAFQSAEERRGLLNDQSANAAAAQQQQFDRLGQAYGQAASTDQFNMANRNSGMAAGFEAQRMRDNRIQQGFDNQIGFGQVLAGMGGGRINADYARTESEVNAGMGQATDAYTAQTAAAERQYQEYLAAMNSASDAAGFYRPKPPSSKKKP